MNPEPRIMDDVKCACNKDQQSAVDPCTLVIFGASGDLTSRKLVPALYTLYRNGRLPEPIAIVGCSRTQLTHQQFRDGLKEAMLETMSETGAPVDGWDDFSERLSYQQVEYDSPESFADLAEFVRELAGRRHTKGNLVFYIATPPFLYPVIAEMIGASGLSRENVIGNGWVRIVVEKPFGRDLETAIELDHVLHNNFKERQIFRIDHYLAKETVQNILMFRFANTIFEPVWNRNHVEYVGILAAEKLGVEHRAGYYEKAGVLRDMFQNHMMQLLSLTTMEPPSFFEAARVQDEKVKIFRSLKPFAPGELRDNIILGQYAPGYIDGASVPGYRNEPGVSTSSCTPTFAVMRLFVDNWRWRGVPFYIASGKRLKQKKTRIVVQFKDVPHSMFRDVLDGDITANRLVMEVYPDEGISVRFEAKKPGSRLCLKPVQMEYTYQKEDGPAFDSYEKVLLDCISGDHMLFWRQDGVELSWSFLSPILAESETCAERDALLHPYPSGSWGPKQAEAWMRLILGEGLF